MTTWASSYLLTKFNQLAGRPPADAGITDAQKYQRLTDAQNAVIADIAARAPWTLYQKVGYGSIPTLTTTDNQVFTFGTDVNGDPLFPQGKVMIYPNVNAIPGYPWVEGWDYLQEGTQIRIPNNGTWSQPLYWRGIAPVLDITASNQPSIIPPPARILIVLEAVRVFGEEGNRNPALAATMAAEYGKQFPRWMLVFKTQFKSGGALGSLSGLTLSMSGIGINGVNWP